MDSMLTWRTERTRRSRKRGGHAERTRKHDTLRPHCRLSCDARNVWHVCPPLPAVQAASPRVPDTHAQAPLGVVLGADGAKVVQRACHPHPTAACIGEPLAFGILGGEGFVRAITVCVVRYMINDGRCLHACRTVVCYCKVYILMLPLASAPPLLPLSHLIDACLSSTPSPRSTPCAPSSPSHWWRQPWSGLPPTPRPCVRRPGSPPCRGRPGLFRWICMCGCV